MINKGKAFKLICWVFLFAVAAGVWLFPQKVRDSFDYYDYLKNRVNHGSKIEHGCVTITMPRGWSIVKVINSNVSVPSFYLAKHIYADERYFYLAVHLSKDVPPDRGFTKTISEHEYAIRSNRYPLHIKRVEFDGHVFFRESLVLPEYNLRLSSENFTKHHDYVKELIDVIESTPGCKDE